MTLNSKKWLSLANDTDPKIRERYIRRIYTTLRDDFEPEPDHWLHDDLRVTRLIQYLQDPAPEVWKLAWAILQNLHSVDAFHHRPEVRIEALAVARDELISFERRMAGIALLVSFDDPAAERFIKTAFDGIDSMSVESSEVVNGIGFVWNAVDGAPNPSYVPLLEDFVARWAEIGWVQDAPFQDLIDDCRNSTGN
jgi:hypothetical protein